MYPKADSTMKQCHFTRTRKSPTSASSGFPMESFEFIGLPLYPTCRVGNNGSFMHFCLELRANEADRCLEA